MKHLALTMALAVLSLSGFAQQDSVHAKKQRLDFAKTYFEVGGTFLPSFQGKTLVDQNISTFENPASAIQYFNWGGFHFWGHAELYMTIPLGYYPFQTYEGSGAEILHSVATGARYLPWAYREKKLRPYVGVAWSALDFKQKIKPDENQPVLSKDFLPSFDAGLLFGYKNFVLRLGLLYLPDTRWEYPLSKTQKEEISTPNLGLQVGMMYSMDFSKKNDQATIDEWNSYPRVSKQSLGSTKFGDFFIGVGPSLAFSLVPSAYNQQVFPYLKDQMASTTYFDFALGYHFQKLGLFTTLSFRNPKFETEGFGDKQSIRRTSLAFELNKFLLDYTGFTPFIGLNVAYDRISYKETKDGNERSLLFKNRTEPGITFGWDIQPGKNQEALILRTNLRWYPFSSFEIDGKAFDFSQLEYNLIQIVFYPSRLKKK